VTTKKSKAIRADLKKWEVARETGKRLVVTFFCPFYFEEEVAVYADFILKLCSACKARTNLAKAEIVRPDNYEYIFDVSFKTENDYAAFVDNLIQFNRDVTWEIG